MDMDQLSASSGSVARNAASLVTDRPGTPFIDVLPVEILDTIFKCAVHLQIDCINLWDLMPLQLTSVCSRWRRIATNNPCLWTSINYVGRGMALPPQAVLCRKLESQRQILKLYLDRSGILPLDVVIIKFDTLSFGETDFAYLREAILPCSHRWRTLRFTTDDIDWLDGEKLHFPKLELLDIRAFSSKTHFDWRLAAPNLQSVVIYKAISAAEDIILHLPWRSIKSLYLSCGGDAHTLLEMSENGLSALEDITIEEPRIYPSDPVRQTAGKEAHYPYLRSLNLKNIVNELYYDHDNRVVLNDLSSFLDVLKAPSLTRLTISSSRLYTINWHHDAFLQMLIRCECKTSLQYLSLGQFSFLQDMELAQLLRMLPALRSLTCVTDNVTFTESLVKSLSKQEAGGRMYLVPNLESLEISGLFDCDEALWIDMLELRNHSLLEISLQYKQDDWLREKVQRFKLHSETKHDP